MQYINKKSVFVPGFPHCVVIHEIISSLALIIKRRTKYIFIILNGIDKLLLSKDFD